MRDIQTFLLAAGSTASFTPATIFRAMAGIAVMVAMYILEFRFLKNHKPRNRKVEKAVARGNVVVARRLSMSEDDRYKVDSWYYAEYEYEVNGKTYKYRFAGKQMPTLQLHLYYLKHPAMAFSPLAGGGGSWTGIWVTFLPLIAGGMTIYLLERLF